MEGVTVEGQTLLDRRERVDFEFERQQIFHLYAGKPVLRKIEYLENRVLESLGMLNFWMMIRKCMMEIQSLM